MRKMMLKITKTTMLAAGSLVIATWSAPGQVNQDSPATEKPSKLLLTQLQPKTFISHAAQANSGEVSLGELGVKNAENADLKTFSQQMQTDHQKANDQLKPLAEKYSVSMEQPPGKMEASEKAKLEKLTGAEFDKALATVFLMKHQKAIRLFDTAAGQPSFPSDVKEFANSQLPTLKEHYEKARDVATKVGVSETTITAIERRYSSAVGGSFLDEDEKTEQGAGAKDLKGDTAPKKD